ncbi:hypothetical protein BDR26DRAFT_867745 [Obelidium mucronatum]|nr:hypothetical protein BDR26DRAFT_867745 [Obelidium mucronatum]
MEEKYHHHRTIYGGGGILGLAQALSGVKAHEENSDDESDHESSRRVNNNSGDSFLPRRKSRSSVRFKTQESSEVSEEHEPSKKSLSRKSSMASTTSVYILPDAPKPQALDEFPAASPHPPAKHHTAAIKSLYGKSVVEIDDRSENSKVATIDDMFANSEFRGDQVGSLFLSERMFPDRDDIRAMIQKNRGAPFSVSDNCDDSNTTSRYQQHFNDDPDDVVDIRGSGDIRELVRMNRGHKLPDAMPISQVLNAIAQSHQWTPEEVAQDLAVLDKARIRNVQAARSLSMATWNQLTDLLPSTKDALRRAIGWVP